MADHAMNTGYSILLVRKGNECVASIAELCIAESGPTPQEALAAALRAESTARQAIADGGMPLPPAGGGVDPLPGATRFAGRYLALFKQVLLGYFLVACITAVLLALVLPAVRSRAEQYLNSKDLAADARKVFSRLGVTVCSDAR